MKASELKKVLEDLIIESSDNINLSEGTAEYFYFLPTRVFIHNENMSILKDNINFNLNIKKPFGIISSDLISILDKLKDRRIKLTVVKDKMILTSAKVKIKFTAITGNEIIDIIEEFKIKEVIKKLKLAPSNFIEGLDSCIESVTTKQNLESDLTLTSLLISNNKIVGSDRFRISEYILNRNLNTTFMLPRKTIINLLTLFKKGYSKKLYLYNDEKSGIAYFKYNNMIIICRKIAGKYPEYKDFFNLGSSEEIKLSSQLLKIVNISEVMTVADTKDSSKLIKLSFNGKDKNVIVKSIKESGEVVGEVSMESIKKTFSFYINPIFLIKIYDKIKKMRVGVDKILFEKDNFRHIISLR
jgi:hypothetical protein